MAKASSKSSKPGAGAQARTSEPSVAEAPDAQGRQGAVCTVGFCPICLAVTAMQPVRPDVIEHLMLAGRELLLAAKAVLDARTETEGTRPHLEKIDIA